MATTTEFDLDVEIVAPTDTPEVTPDSAREIIEKSGLTPGTVNTYAMGLAMCVTCC
jgi:hypothetical protein